MCPSEPQGFLELPCPQKGPSVLSQVRCPMGGGLGPEAAQKRERPVAVTPTAAVFSRLSTLPAEGPAPCVPAAPSQHSPPGDAPPWGLRHPWLAQDLLLSLFPLSGQSVSCWFIPISLTTLSPFSRLKIQQKAHLPMPSCRTPDRAGVLPGAAPVLSSPPSLCLHANERALGRHLWRSRDQAHCSPPPGARCSRGTRVALPRLPPWAPPGPFAISPAGFWSAPQLHLRPPFYQQVPTGDFTVSCL